MVPEHMEATILRVAKHEAGHYIAGRVLGFKVGPLSLQLTDLRGGYRGGAEITLGENISEKADILEYLNRRIQTLYAGVLSEAMVDGIVDPAEAIDYLNKGGKGDFDKARELLQLYRNIEHGTCDEGTMQIQLSALNDQFWNKSGDIIQEEWELIDYLATQLIIKVVKVGVTYILQEEEIDAMPPIIARFKSISA